MFITSAIKKRDRDRASLSDSDMEDLLFRGRKVLRSRIIGLDTGASDEGPIVLSDFPGDVSAKIRGKRSTPMRLREEQSFSDLSFTECPSRLASEDLANKNVDESNFLLPSIIIPSLSRRTL